MAKKKSKKDSGKKTSSKENYNSGLVGYIFGILSIVLSFFTAWGIGGIVCGIIGLVQSKKEKDNLSNKGKRLSIIGLIIGGIVFIASLILLIISMNNPSTLQSTAQQFPAG